MVTPQDFLDLADEEAYQQALERLVCDYCGGYKYSNRKPLNEPMEVYSSLRKVKRWICICRTCLRTIAAYERKKYGKNKVHAQNYFYYEDVEDDSDHEED